MDGRFRKTLKIGVVAGLAGSATSATVAGYALIAALVAAGASGCNGDTGSRGSHEAGARQSRPLHLYAAASMIDVAAQLAAYFPRADVALTTGSSSVLARQIADGAPADVFISASRDWMEYLNEAGALAGPPLLLATSGISCVTSSESPLSAQNAAELLTVLGVGDVVGIADSGVPAGEYARAALRSTGVLERMAPRLVGLSDARAVVRAVQAGDAVAGFAYTTDASLQGLRTLFRFGADLHPPVEYLAAVMAGSRNKDAALAFVELASGENGARVLTEMGFSRVEGQGRGVTGTLSSPETEIGR